MLLTMAGKEAVGTDSIVAQKSVGDPFLHALIVKSGHNASPCGCSAAASSEAGVFHRPEALPLIQIATIRRPLFSGSSSLLLLLLLLLLLGPHPSNCAWV
jgi:hypothetical protein